MLLWLPLMLSRFTWWKRVCVCSMKNWCRSSWRETSVASAPRRRTSASRCARSRWWLPPWSRTARSCWIMDRHWKNRQQQQSDWRRQQLWQSVFTHVEAQPMRGFSQRSRLSNSICHVLMLSVPLCMAFLGGTWMRTRRSFSCSSGTPDRGLTLTATGTVILPLSLLRCSTSSGRARAVLGSSGAMSEDAQRAAVLGRGERKQLKHTLPVLLLLQLYILLHDGRSTAQQHLTN